MSSYLTPTFYMQTITPEPEKELRESGKKGVGKAVQARR
jgi:hypothetical protein